MELEFEDRETEAAAEGTAAHALVEHKLRKALKMRSTRPVSQYDSDEMEMYTDGYLEFVLEAIEKARQDCPDPKVLIEQRLDFSCYVPDGFGTGDCLIVADKLLHIIDSNVIQRRADGYSKARANGDAKTHDGSLRGIGILLSFILR